MRGVPFGALASSQVSTWVGPDRTVVIPSRPATSRAIVVVDTRSAMGAYAASVNTTGSPYSAIVDDLILVVGSAIYNGTGNTLTPSSSGLSFTSIGGSTGSGTANLQCQAWYAWQPDTTGRGVTLTTSASYCSLRMDVLVLRGVDKTTPVDASYASDLIASSSSPSVAALTTSRDNALAFAHLLTGDDNTISCTSSGWTGSGVNIDTAESMILVRKTIPVAGSTGSIDFSFGANGPDQSKYATWAIRPAIA